MFSKAELRKSLPFSDEDLIQEISDTCEVKTFSRNDVIVREGQFVKNIPVVLSGALRVFQTREEREILLYYVKAGQTCMMSLSACFYNNASPSRAEAAEKSEVLLVPANYVTQWQRIYSAWNEYVIRTFRNRYDELLTAFESVAFDKTDRRILDYLRQHQQKGIVKISHLQLANELGTTRVVVSRILKQFESDKRVKINRGSIRILE
jgi:CRP/FNR family transcriptional regulator